MIDRAYNSLRSQCLEKLLAGNVIYEFSFERGYLLLQNPDEQSLIDSIMRQMGRSLVETEDGAGFYLAYSDLASEEVRKSIAAEVRSLSEDWEPLLRWLMICRDIDDNGFPLRPGDPLMHSDLIKSAENSLNTQENITTIASRFNVRAQSVEAALEGILSRLIERGYLIKDGSRPVYLATARWSLLREQMEYVRGKEGIIQDLIEQDEAAQHYQGDML